MTAMIDSLRNQCIDRRYHLGPIGFETAETTLVRVVRTMLRWYERSQQRRHLSSLTAWELDDIGVNPVAAAKEAAKPFWRA